MHENDAKKEDIIGFVAILFEMLVRVGQCWIHTLEVRLGFTGTSITLNKITV